jgi:hypothetical protein
VLWPSIHFDLLALFKLFVEMAPLKFFANFQIKLFFHGQGQSNISMVSLSTSHVPPPTLLVVFESSNPSAHELLAKKPKWFYDKFQIFQNSWVAKFPWVESILGEELQVLLVKSMICSIVEGKDKFLSLKLDTLQKHVGRNFFFVDFIGIVIGDSYYNKESTHAENEKLYGGNILK